MKIRILISLTITLALLLGGMLLGSGKLEGAAKQTLTAKSVKAAPTGLDDPVWNQAKSIQVPFEGKEKFEGKKASFDTRAVYTGDSIYFLFKWKSTAVDQTPVST